MSFEYEWIQIWVKKCGEYEQIGIGRSRDSTKRKASHAYYKKEAGGDPCVQQV